MRKLYQKGNKRNVPENLQNQQSNLTLILGITVVLGPFKEASDRMTKDGCLYQLVTEVLKPHLYASFLVMFTRPLMRKGGFIEGTQKINHKWTQNLSQQLIRVRELLQTDYKNVHLLGKTFCKEPRKKFNWQAG